MTDVEQLITENVDVWGSAVKRKSTRGRGSSKKIDLYGIKKLRGLILDLAVRGLLVPQDLNDEPASALLKKITDEKKLLIKEGKIRKQKKLPPIGESEKLFSLPGGWEWCRLGVLLNKITDGTHHSPPNGDAGEFLYITAKNIKNSGVQLSNATYVTRLVHEEIYSRCDPEKGDILYIKDGATTGIATINNLDEPFSMLSSVALLKGSKLLSSEFVLQSLRSPLFYKEMRAGMTGVAITRVTLRKLESAYIPVPPQAEQHRVVAKVHELMALCDQLEQQQENSISAHQTLVEALLAALISAGKKSEFNQAWARIAEHFDTLFTTEHSIDQLKQTILQLAVMGKLVPQDPNDEPARVLLEKIAAEKAQLIKDKKIKRSNSVDSIIRENCDWSCPRQWSEVELQNLFKFIDYRGKNPEKSDKGMRIITAKNIRMGFVKEEPIEYISEELYKTWMVRGFPKVGDILFITEGHTMGFVAQVALNYEFALAQRTICFQPFLGLDVSYFLYALMSQQFQNIIRDNQTGSAAGGIKASKLKRVPIPVPPLAEQYRIVEKVKGLMILCDELKVRINESQSTQLHLADAMAEHALSNEGAI
mgnify:CR=1 FL=1